MNILGISCFYHDSAACLVQDGKIIAAAEEERFSRRKHDSRFPEAAIRFVLDYGQITGKNLDAVVFYEKPLTKIERMLQTSQTYNNEKDTHEFLARQLSHELHTSLALPALIETTCGYKGKILYSEHHLSHAACAFLSSPFDEAAILTIDGVGEWTTTSISHGRNGEIFPLQAIRYPHSLGLLYAAFTAYLGFEVNEGEYKVMGLASYGKPIYLDKLRKVIALYPDGSFELDLSYFAFTYSNDTMFSPKLIELLGPARQPNAPMLPIYMDIAASLQKLIEEAILNLACAAKQATSARYLCLGGGVAHNIVANVRLRDSGLFEDVFVHFASGDNGGAIGAALYGNQQLSETKQLPCVSDPYLGPAYDDQTIEAILVKRKITYEKLTRENLLETAAELLADSFIIGWFQGRMEFGPRALGNRSILANPCNPQMKDILNARVKRREEFRPFAPAVLWERTEEYFEMPYESAVMLFAAQVRADKRDVIPAVTHIDGTARAQTVRREQNPIFYDLIKAFAAQTGVPVLINTSFNIRGEPVVATPDDALNCFLGTDIDFLILGSFLIKK